MKNKPLVIHWQGEGWYAFWDYGGKQIDGFRYGETEKECEAEIQRVKSESVGLSLWGGAAAYYYKPPPQNGEIVVINHTD